MVHLQNIFCTNVAKLINEAQRMGYVISFGEVWRSPETQKIYLKTGRSKTLNSMHLKRLAVDFNFFYQDEIVTASNGLLALGNYWRSLHPANRWGGDWNGDGKLNTTEINDFYHFEMKH